MKVLIGIATYKRIEKLQRCLDSLKNSSYQNFETLIVADNVDIETRDYLLRTIDKPNIVVQPSRCFVIGAWNLALQYGMDRFDGFIGLCDDVELERDTLENAVKAHRYWFPDTDGVIGLHQTCPNHPEYTFKWFGQTLMGRKFIERYKEVDYRVCCPDYFHFVQDEEMFQYASSLEKFKECPEASLKHYHPSFLIEERDETHGIVRFGHESPKLLDFQMKVERGKRGYLWGRDFNLVGKDYAKG